MLAMDSDESTESDYYSPTTSVTDRRRFLAACGASTILAGCSALNSDGDSEPSIDETENGTGDETQDSGFDFSDQQPVSAPMRRSNNVGPLFSPVARGPRNEPGVAWTHSVGFFPENLYINDHAIHVAGDTTLEAIDHDGEHLWEEELETFRNYVADDYILMMNGLSMVERDSRTGSIDTTGIELPSSVTFALSSFQPIWATPDPESEIVLQVTNDRDFQPAEARYVRWDRDTETIVETQTEFQAEMAPIGTDGEQIYGHVGQAVSGGGSIVALDVDSLERTEIIESEDMKAIGSSPAYTSIGYANGRIYYYRTPDGEDPSRVAVDVNTGNIDWEHSIPPTEQSGPMQMYATDDKYIYNSGTVSSVDNLIVIEQETGEVAWEHSGVSATTVGGDIVYGAAGDRILLLDRETGEEIDTIETGVSSLVAYKDRLICISNTGDIIVVAPNEL